MVYGIDIMVELEKKRVSDTYEDMWPILDL